MFQTLRDRFTDDGDPMPWRSVAVTCLAVMGPPIVAVLIFGRIGAVAFIATLAAHLAAKDSGILIGGLVTVVMGFAGLLTVGAPDMALMVAPTLGIMAGVAGYYGFALPVMRALITWTVFTGPIFPADDKPLLFAIFLGAMIWALGVSKLFGESGNNEPAEADSEAYALVFGAMLAAGLGISVWIGGRWFGQHGFWFPLTFVVLCVPPHGRLFGRTVKRTVGTLLGTAVALGFAWLSDATWLMIALGAICLPLGFRVLPANYTLFTALLTVAVLEVLALVSDVDRLAWERVATMGAAAVMTAALAGLGLVGLWLIRPAAIKALWAQD